MKKKYQNHQIQCQLSLFRKWEKASKEVSVGLNIQIRPLRKSTSTVNKIKTNKLLQPKTKRFKDRFHRMYRKRHHQLRGFTTIQASFETQRQVIRVMFLQKMCLKDTLRPRIKRKGFLQVTFNQSTQHHRNILQFNSTRLKTQKGWKRRILWRKFWGQRSKWPLRADTT